MFYNREELRELVNTTFTTLKITPAHFYADTRKTLGIEGRDMKWRGIPSKKAKAAVELLNAELVETPYIAVVTNDAKGGVRLRTRKYVTA